MSASDVSALPDCAQRLAVARNAAYEIEALGTLLQQGLSTDAGVDPLAIRGVVMRLKDLARIVMSAVDDEADPVDEIVFRLTGDRAARGGL